MARLLRFTPSFKFIGRFLKWYTHTLFCGGCRPLILSYYLTDGCNNKCSMCGLHVGRKGQTITLERFRESLDILGDTCAYVTLGGGEPLTIPNILEYIRYARHKVPYVHLNTNGSFVTVDFARQCADARLNEVSISLDGPPELHNVTRGNADSYDSALAALSIFRQHAPRVRLVVNTVLAHWNYRSIPALLQFSEQLEALHVFHPVVDLFGCDLDTEIVDPVGKIPESDVEVLVGMLLSKKHVINSSYFLKSLPFYFKTGRMPFKNSLCILPKIFCEVCFDDTFRPCGFVIGKNRFWPMDRLSDEGCNFEYGSYVKSLASSCTLCNDKCLTCYWEPRLLLSYRNICKALFPLMRTMR